MEKLLRKNVGAQKRGDRLEKIQVYQKLRRQEFNLSEKNQIHWLKYISKMFTTSFVKNDIAQKHKH